MNNEKNKDPLPPLVLVACCCAVASVAIAALAFSLLHNISGSGIWAIAAMAAAPSVMGIATTYFMTKHPRQDASPTESQVSPSTGNVQRP